MALECLEGRCCPSTVDLWTGGTGNYSDATKWSLGFAPTNGPADTYTAEIPADSTVTLDMNATIDNLTLDSASSMLVMPDGSSLTIMGNTGAGSTAGSIDNAGTIAMDAASADTDLNVGGGGVVTLGGGGTVTMSNSARNIIGNQAAGTLVNVDNTIQGVGTIEALSQFVNRGTVDADQATPLIFHDDVGSVINAGSLEASGGGTLVLAQTIGDSGGTILATGSGSTVNLGAKGENAATIIGGTLTTQDSGAIAIQGSTGTATLDDVTISAGSVYTVADGQATVLQGAIINHGTILLVADGSGATVDVSGLVTLAGGGTVKMNNLGDNLNVGSSDTLTNVDNLILGSGEITNRGHLVNQGAIGNTFGSQVVLDAVAPIDNPGSLSAYGGAIFIAGVINNAGGTILSIGDLTTVGLDASQGPATIDGGTLTTQLSGFIGTSYAPYPATLNGVTISTGSQYTVSGSSTSILEGTITNQGTILLDSGSNGAGLEISGSVTLTGGGTVKMILDSNSIIEGTGPGASLSNGAGDPAVVRGLIEQRDELKAVILDRAMQEPATSETLAKVLQDNGLWDIVTTPGGDPYHAAQFDKALSTLDASDTGDINALQQRYNTAKLAGNVADMALVQRLEDARNSKYQSDETDLTSYQTSITHFVDATKDADTIEGVGQIGGLGQLVNLGTIVANQESETPLAIRQDVTTLDNLGTLEATGGASLNLAGAVINEGTEWADAGSTIAVSNDTQSSGLTLVADSATFSDSSSFSQTGGSTTIETGGGLTAPAFTQVAGLATIDGALTASPVTIAGALIGTGTVAGAVTNSGTIVPGDAPTPGELNITGPYTQMGPLGGNLDIALGGTIAGAGGFSALNVGGMAILDGYILNVSLVNGFHPLDGEAFAFLNDAGTTGNFTTIEGSPGGNFSYTADYLATGVILTAHVTVAPPAASTSPASGVTETSATLSASVNPMGGATTVYFIVGTDPTLGGGWTGIVTPAPSLEGGMNTVSATAGVDGLAPGTTYYERVVATNAAGVTQGEIVSFTTATATLPPIPTPTATSPAAATAMTTSVTGTAAMLVASVNPMGGVTTAYFVYGTDPTLSTGTTTTAAQSLGGGNGAMIVTAALTGLQPGATYYDRLVATSAAGTTTGGIVSFNTTAPAPIVTIASAHYATATTIKGKKTRKVKAIDLQLSAPINAAAAQNLAAYALLSGKAKKSVVHYSTPVALSQAHYDAATQSLTLIPRNSVKLTRLMQLRITTVMLSDTLGRPVNNGQGIVVTINRSAFTITS